MSDRGLHCVRRCSGRSCAECPHRLRARLSSVGLACSAWLLFCSHKHAAATFSNKSTGAFVRCCCCSINVALCDDVCSWQDGYLAYAVTWMEPGSASASRHAIADRALAHALIRHLGPGAEVSGHADLLDDALVRKGTPPDALANAHRCAPMLLSSAALRGSCVSRR